MSVPFRHWLWSQVPYLVHITTKESCLYSAVSRSPTANFGLCPDFASSLLFNTLIADLILTLAWILTLILLYELDSLLPGCY